MAIVTSPGDMEDYRRPEASSSMLDNNETVSFLYGNAKPRQINKLKWKLMYI